MFFKNILIVKIYRNINKNIFNNFLITESRRTHTLLFQKLSSPKPVPESRNAPVLHSWQTSSPSSSTSVSNMGFKHDFVNKKDEVSYAYFFDNPSIISRVVVDKSGLHQILMWNDGDLHWKEFYSAPKYRCDNYGHYGAYGKFGPQSSDNVDNFKCTCLPGYEPKSPKDWYHRDGSEGCVR